MTIKEYRKEILGWTTIRAADELGVSRQQLHAWETGTPSGSTLIKIARIYGCVISFFPSKEGITEIRCRSHQSKD